jgi:hypothetical protein
MVIDRIAIEKGKKEKKWCAAMPLIKETATYIMVCWYPCETFYATGLYALTNLLILVGLPKK